MAIDQSFLRSQFGKTAPAMGGLRPLAVDALLIQRVEQSGVGFDVAHNHRYPPKGAGNAEVRQKSADFSDTNRPRSSARIASDLPRMRAHAIGGVRTTLAGPGYRSVLSSEPTGRRPYLTHEPRRVLFPCAQSRADVIPPGLINGRIALR